MIVQKLKIFNPVMIFHFEIKWLFNWIVEDDIYKGTVQPSR